MLNYKNINDKEINFIDFIGEEKAGEKSSSFSNEILTKYSFKSDLGIIFNFNTIGNFCDGRQQKYGNLMLKSNPNNIPDIQTKEYQTPLKNGGVYQNRRFEKQVLDFELEVSAPNIQSLEKEIQMMKQVFNSKGKIYKKYNGGYSFLDVVLIEFEVDELKNSGTKINITFESLSPFWISEKKSTKNFENITGNLNTTMYVNDSDGPVDYKAILQIKNIVGNVEKIVFSVLGYEIEITENLANSDVIIFDGKNLSVTKAGRELIYLGEFKDLEIGKPCQIGVTFSPAPTSINYNLYILYDKIIL